MSSAGVIEWQKSLGGTSPDDASSIQQTSDGGFIVTGNSQSNDFNVSGNHGASDFWVVKLNSIGNIEWQKSLGGSDFDRTTSIRQTVDKGYIIAGYTYSNDGDVAWFQGYTDFWIVKLSPARNNISGYIFNDSNSNCIFDSSETPEPNFILQAYPWDSYATTDSNGFYKLSVDSGNYEVRVINPHPYKSILCPAQGFYTVSFNSFDSVSTGNNFGLKTEIYCPLLEVDISTFGLRRCFDNTFIVNYCNKGTADENNAYIVVNFHDSLFVQSSSIPMTTLPDNSYRFNIGTIQINDCGSFTITTKVACDILLGSTLCVSANIFPDTLCEPINPQWDKSSVKVEGICVNDSLACFTIYNTGTPGGGNMQGTSEWRLYINDTLKIRNNFQLNGGDTLQFCFVTTGNTLRLEADQRPGHPGNSHPRKTIEACGTNSQGNHTFGFFVNTPEDDQNKNIEMFCLEVIGSYDPNDKSVKPKGSTPNHYINQKDELEYHINFQNTGTDTAFTVIVRDTIDVQTLDIATIQNGVSSHANTFRIYDHGILEWKFNNILLPDSNVNEPASHGFVKFKVKQKLANPKGTLIENNAAIYFDYNAPVITNTTSNKVWNWDSMIIVKIKNQVITKQEPITLYPNPAGQVIYLINNETPQSSYSFRLFNVMGMKVKDFNGLKNKETRIELGNLGKGIYFYQVISEKGDLINVGKLVVE